MKTPFYIECVPNPNPQYTYNVLGQKIGLSGEKEKLYCICANDVKGDKYYLSFVPDVDLLKTLHDDTNDKTINVWFFKNSSSGKMFDNSLDARFTIKCMLENPNRFISRTSNIVLVACEHDIEIKPNDI